MKHRLRKQMSESFLTAAFLSISGGLQDAYTYLFRGNVFANAQTGNIVLLSQGVVHRDFSIVIRYLIPLSFFALGIAFAEGIRFKFKEIKKLHWRQLVLIIEILLLFIVGFFPSKWDLFANALVSFSCAMQVQTFRKVKGYAFASTMCIGNLRSGVESFCKFAQTKNKETLFKAVCYVGIIFMFAFGAGLGGFFLPRFQVRTIWLSCIFLLISFLFMFIKEDVEEIEEVLSKQKK